MKKVTFTFDDETVATIRRAAAREQRPQSAIVRDAIAAYPSGRQRLTSAERDRMLKILREYAASMPRGASTVAVDRERRGLRSSRQAAGRRRAERLARFHRGR
jgi:predicted transcriptional regulator